MVQFLHGNATIPPEEHCSGGSLAQVALDTYFLTRFSHSRLQHTIDVARPPHRPPLSPPLLLLNFSLPHGWGSRAIGASIQASTHLKRGEGD
jgi:hypothetical protein